MKLHSKTLAVLITVAVVFSAGADDTFPTLEASGITYRNVTITAVTATDVYFTYDGGMGNAKLESLSPELQQHFHYDPTKATAAERQQAQANAQYLTSQPPQWGTDLQAALGWAHSENKCVLMDFTGSDWCPWCIKLDQVVFCSPQFAGFANSKLVLVKVDFPHQIPQSQDVKQANNALAQRFNVDGYPTCILLDPSGKELGRMVGYPEGGPDAFVAKFSSLVPPGVGATTASPTAASSTTTTPAATAPVAQAADAPSKIKQYWYWIPCGAVFLVILRGIKNSL
jgi:thioredoxin-related protein